MQVPRPAARDQPGFEPEASDRLEDLQGVVLSPDLGAHDVAGLDRVPLVVDLDDRPTLEDEPVLVAVMVVPVEGLAGHDLDRAVRDDVGPGGSHLAREALPDVAAAGRVEHPLSPASR